VEKRTMLILTHSSKNIYGSHSAKCGNWVRIGWGIRQNMHTSHFIKTNDSDMLAFTQ